MSHFDERDAARCGFASTHWSVVLRAGDQREKDADQALAELCQRYWQPLYAYVRRRVADVHQAQDLTQEFFAWLLEKHALATANPERGLFRSFLLTAFKNFLANQWDRQRAQKRGGGVRKLSLDLAGEERRFVEASCHNLSPERAYERQWGLMLLERVLEALEKEHVDAGRGAQFAALKTCLTGERERLPYVQVAESLGITEEAARQAAQRLRKRYRELLRQEVAEIVADAGGVDDEIRNLFELLGS